MCYLLIEPIAVQTDRVNSLHEYYRVVKRLSEKRKGALKCVSACWRMRTVILLRNPSCDILEENCT